MKISNINNERPKLFILVGLPASGKSTWTNEKLANSPYSFDVISSDNILEQIARDEGKTYSEVFKDNAAFANSEIWKEFREAVKQRNNIIWDQTNMTSKKRRKILSQIPKEYEKTAVIFEVDQDTLFDRMNKRAEKEGKHIPRHVVENMLQSYQEPHVDEGFDNVIKFEQ